MFYAKKQVDNSNGDFKNWWEVGHYDPHGNWHVFEFIEGMSDVQECLLRLNSIQGSRNPARSW